MNKRNARRKQALRYARYLDQKQYHGDGDAIITIPSSVLWNDRGWRFRSRESKAKYKLGRHRTLDQITRQQIAQQVRMVMAIHDAQVQMRNDPSIYQAIAIEQMMDELDILYDEHDLFVPVRQVDVQLPPWEEEQDATRP